MPLWFASLDLRKAFDRVEWTQLFGALSSQGLANEYLTLLKVLYSGQIGVLGDARTFNIQRGVRQGDVLSPLLFNAALKAVMGNKEFFLKIKDPTLGTKPKPKVTPEELKKMVEKHRNEPKMSVEDL